MLDVEVGRVDGRLGVWERAEVGRQCTAWTRGSMVAVFCSEMK